MLYGTRAAITQIFYPKWNRPSPALRKYTTARGWTIGQAGAHMWDECRQGRGCNHAALFFADGLVLYKLQALRCIWAVDVGTCSSFRPRACVSLRRPQILGEPAEAACNYMERYTRRRQDRETKEIKAKATVMMVQSPSVAHEG
jgi:hypothetical protein